MRNPAIELRRRPLVMDGAMATMLRGGASETDIYQQYVEAGADILTTNTFMPGGAPEKSARIARLAAGPERYVVGIIGPTYSPAEARQASRALVNGGADALMLETVCSPTNAFEVGRVIRQELDDIELLFSTTLTPSGTLLCGATIREFVETLLPLSPLSLGFNCGYGAAHLVRFIEQLGPLPCFKSLHPSAGLPNGSGHYPDDPAAVAETLRPLIESHVVNIVGGCCGTTPEHIRALAEIIFPKGR